MNQNWLNRLERKYGRYGIENLMNTIVIGMGLIYVLDFFFYGSMRVSLSSMLAFDRTAILHGQIWRLLTFIFIPPNTSLLFILISLYFYWMLGSLLEQHWGTFRFNVFYLCGMLGTIVSGMITGYATNNFLNLSLFLAFALLYPNFEVLLFMILPIKIKYLAMLDAASLVFLFFTSTWSGKLALIVSLINLLLFFGGDLNRTIKNAKRRRDWKNQFRN